MNNAKNEIENNEYFINNIKHDKDYREFYQASIDSLEQDLIRKSIESNVRSIAIFMTKDYIKVIKVAEELGNNVYIDLNFIYFLLEEVATSTKTIIDISSKHNRIIEFTKIVLENWK
ncbi:MAG: hypothetical protein Q9M91_02705 [Candidatus Dojkabacteria bacterium]|nr:hypothetical protein [Candidatus Dojkabacteria bacterium]MDQ7020735.1 hypothetical protein [Candidatus Dojkabacteria bacterium]